MGQILSWVVWVHKILTWVGWVEILAWVAWVKKSLSGVGGNFGVGRVGLRCLV